MDASLPIDWTTGFLGALGRASVQAGLLVLVILALQAVFGRRLGPRWEHTLWLLVVLRLGLPVTLPSPLSLYNLLPDWSEGGARGAPDSGADPQTPQVGAPAAARPDPVEAVAAGSAATLLPDRAWGGPPDGAGPAWSPVEVPAFAAVPHPAFAAADPGPAGHGGAGLAGASTPGRSAPLVPPWPVWLTAAWLGGLVFCGLRVAGASRATRSLLAASRPVDDPVLAGRWAAGCRRLGLRRVPEVREVAAACSPALAGLWRPVLLVPRGFGGSFSAAEQEGIFLHEAAHLRRLDLPLNWALAAIQVVYWFHPLVWLAFARLRAAREMACDALAMERAESDEVRAGFGRTILRLVDGVDPRAVRPLQVAILEDRRALRRRLAGIAAFRPGRRLAASALVPIVVLGVVALTDAAVETTPPGPRLAALQTLPLPVPAVTTGREMGGDYLPYALLPTGDVTWGGVPFRFGGVNRLWSRAMAPLSEHLLDAVAADAGGVAFEVLHLAAILEGDDGSGAPAAHVVFEYVDGTSERIVLRAGVHLRDWWGMPAMRPVLYPHSHVAWTAPHPSPQKAPFLHHASRVSLANPRPELAVRTIRVVSARDLGGVGVLGLTLDPLPLGARAVPEAAATIRPLPGATVRVTVLEAATGRPVPGITVQSSAVNWTRPVAEAGISFRESGVTGPDGGVTLPRPDEPGRGFRLVAGIGSGNYALQTVDVADVGAHTFRLEGGLRIGGRVVDPSGQPVRGATARAWVSLPPGAGANDAWKPLLSVFGRHAWASSDADGFWVLEGLPPSARDQLQVEVRLEGHENAEPRAQANGLRAGELALMEEGRHVTILSPWPSFRGRVVDAAGAPVPGARVVVVAGHTETPVTESGPDGSFAALLSAGRPVSVSASPPTMTLAAGYAVLPDRFDPAVDEALVRLMARRPFRGVVRDASGEPLPGIPVQHGLSHVRLPHGGLARVRFDWSSVTAADGTFEWLAAPPDPVVITLGGGESGYRRHAVEVTVARGPHEFVLEPEEILLGRAVDPETREPVAGVEVYLGTLQEAEMLAARQRGDDPEHVEPSLVQSSALATTGADGRFRVKIDQHGANRLVLMGPGRRRTVVEYEGFPDAADPDAVPRDIPLPASEPIRLTVLKPDGTPAAGAEAGTPYTRSEALVLVEGFHLRSGFVRVAGADGVVTLPGDAGRILVVHEAGFATARSEEIVASGGVVRLRGWGRIEGRVRRSGRPMVGVEVMASAPRIGGYSLGMAAGVQTGVVRADGSYTIEPALPEEVSVGVYPVREATRASRMSLAHRGVRVAPGGTTVVDFDIDTRLLSGRWQWATPPRGDLLADAWPAMRPARIPQGHYVAGWSDDRTGATKVIGELFAGFVGTRRPAWGRPGGDLRDDGTWSLAVEGPGIHLVQITVPDALPQFQFWAAVPEGPAGDVALPGTLMLPGARLGAADAPRQVARQDGVMVAGNVAPDLEFVLNFRGASDPEVPEGDLARLRGIADGTERDWVRILALWHEFEVRTTRWRTAWQTQDMAVLDREGAVLDELAARAEAWREFPRGEAVWMAMAGAERRLARSLAPGDPFPGEDWLDALDGLLARHPGNLVVVQMILAAVATCDPERSLENLERLVPMVEVGSERQYVRDALERTRDAYRRVGQPVAADLEAFLRARGYTGPLPQAGRALVVVSSFNGSASHVDTVSAVQAQFGPEAVAVVELGWEIPDAPGGRSQAREVERPWTYVPLGIGENLPSDDPFLRLLRGRACVVLDRAGRLVDPEARDDLAAAVARAPGEQP